MGFIKPNLYIYKKKKNCQRTTTNFISTNEKKKTLRPCNLTRIDRCIDLSSAIRIGSSWVYSVVFNRYIY